MEIALSFGLLMANIVVMGISLFVGLTIIMVTAMLCLHIITKLMED